MVITYRGQAPADGRGLDPGVGLGGEKGGDGARTCWQALYSALIAPGDSRITALRCSAIKSSYSRAGS